MKLVRNGDKTEVEEVWSTRKIQFYHVNSIQMGDYIYGSTGTMGPAFVAAVDIRTGKVAWRKRGFAKANCVYADGRLILLDEDGNLALTTISPEDFTVHSQVQLLDNKIVMLPDTFISNIEGPSGQNRNFQGAGDQAIQFLAGHNRRIGSMAVDIGYFAVTFVGTHEVVDSICLLEYGIEYS